MVTFGIVGLPNVGKSTLFNALTRRAQAEVSNYPFCTVEPNVSVVAVPDPRLEALQAVFQQQQVVPTAIEIVDIAGLVRGAHEGQGLGNQFLAHIREVDALLHVVRCFPDQGVAHVEGGVDPVRDRAIVARELLAADEATVQRRLERAEAAAKAGDPDLVRERTWTRSLAAHLEDNRPARTWSDEGPEETREAWLRDLFLLTAKPELVVANLGDDPESSGVAFRDLTASLDPGQPLIAAPARLELELMELDAADARAFRAEYGQEQGALDQLLAASYLLMRLVTFYTGVGKELRAWTVPEGTPVDRAAGRIHTSMREGFIRAEVVPCDDLVRVGSWAAARDAGKLSVQGRGYLVADGDVIHVRFKE